MADIYNWSKPVTRNNQNPSFSSSLLDEIYRSIDGGDEKFSDFKSQKPKTAKKQSGRSKSKTSVQDEEIAGFRQACLVDKWMEMKRNDELNKSRRLFDQKMALDNDPLFFSSGSSSSDSSFGWYSEAEVVKPKPSCFGPTLNRVKTSVVKKQNVVDVGDDNDNAGDSGLARSKTRALKLYASLKRVKQPISPGGRLTTFLNGIFANGKSNDCREKTQTPKSNSKPNPKPKSKAKSTNVSTCSSASSFSRSCLSKIPPRGASDRGGKNTLNRETSRIRFPDSQGQEIRKSSPWVKPDFGEFLRKYNNEKIDVDVDEDNDDDDDMASDSSSDLFELDHLGMFKNEPYCEELPVYETTHVATATAIASGLIF